MLGHATLLIEIDGKKILTDPWLTEPLYFGQLTHSGDFKPPEQLPPIDLVLVSHGHQDHFDPATIEMIPEDTPVVIFKGYEKTAVKSGFKNVHPVMVGNTWSADSVKISAMTGKHPGGIVTYMIQGQEGKIYFGGDSIFTTELENALKDTRPDICLMPISGGAFGPFKFHMNAKEAAKLIKSSGAKRGIPIHYHFQVKKPFLNRFIFRINCLDEFRSEMNSLTPAIPVTVLDYNETWEG